MNDAHLTRSRILIVDDQPANVLLLEKIVQRAGFENVSTATDAREVDDRVRTFKPDILLLDLQMPHLDGFAVMGRLAEVREAEYLPVLVLTADATLESKRRALATGANDFLVKPFDSTEVVLRIKNLLQMRWLQSQLRDQNESLELKVRERTAELWDSVRRLERAEDDLLRSQGETVRRLSIAAEFRDDETARHIERMSRYCALLYELAGGDGSGRATIQTASQMHDIGKIGTPDSILLKPGKLTAEQRKVMERHAEDGWRILEGSESALLQLAATIALTHHERVDGTGYPNGLRGDEIPLSGRIAAIADVFDALSTDRIYRRALPLPEVWRIMREGRGTHFDADLLDLFFDSMDAFMAVLDATGAR
jgi:putative two-component system response regulator